MDNISVIHGVEPKSTPAMVQIVRGVLDSALEGNMTYFSVEYVVDGRRNAYSVKVDGKD